MQEMAIGIIEVVIEVVATIIVAVTKLGKIVGGPIKQQFKYFFCFQNNMQS